MSTQLQLFDEPPPPQSKRVERAPDRLLFVTYLSDQAAADAEILGVEVARRSKLQGSAIRRDLLHVTLHHLGDYDGLPPDLVAAAMAVGDSICAQPFQAEFDRLTSFGREGHASPVVLWKRDDNNAPLRAFQQTLSLALRSARLSADGKFNPHVTVRWDKANVAEEAIQPLRWTVDSFALVHSLQGRAIHIPLKRWTLSS